MGIRKQKPGRQTTGSGAERMRVGRDYVEEVQRRAARLNEAIEKKTENYSGEDFAERQQQYIQQHMAQLRSEALHARRLAEQIQNLSQDGAAQKRKPVMNDTSLVDPSPARRASDKHRTSGSPTSFNPLHPSMELPPEQLIRLLGLEGKKTRKRRKPAAANEVKPPKEVVPAKELAPNAGSTANSWTLPDDMVPASRKRAPKSVNTVNPPARTKPRRSHAEEPLFQERRKGLLLPAVAIGALAGIAASAYLFWSQPAPEPTAAPTRAAVIRSPAAAKAVAPKPTAAKIPPPSRAATASPTQRKQPEAVNDAKWRAAVQAQEQRIRAAAEERLRERMQAANYRAAETTRAAVPPISQDTAETLAVPPQSIDAPPDRLNPDVVAIETPAVPAEQQSPAVTNDATPSTPVEASTHTEMPFSPEPAHEIDGQEPAALRPSADVNETPQAIEALEDATAAENSTAQPVDAIESPADVVRESPGARADENEPGGPEASF